MELYWQSYTLYQYSKVHTPLHQEKEVILVNVQFCQYSCVGHGSHLFTPLTNTAMPIEVCRIDLARDCSALMSVIKYRVSDLSCIGWVILKYCNVGIRVYVQYLSVTMVKIRWESHGTTPVNKFEQTYPGSSIALLTRVQFTKLDAGRSLIFTLMLPQM